jgi:hypothetical protein
MIEKKARIASNIRVGPDQRRSEREQAKANKQRAAEIAAHATELSTIPEDIVVDRNGERQLLTLKPRELNAVGLLMCTDVHPVNVLLRRGSTLSERPGAWIEYSGYESNQAFVDEAVDMFVRLGTALELDEPIRLYRGVRLFNEPDEFDQDLAGLSAHLLHGSPWIPRFLDLGFSFASTDATAALEYPLDKDVPLEKTFRILIELEADRGLCAPSRATRSQDLFAQLHGVQYLDDADSQVLFSPGTEWEIVSVDAESEHGVPLVRMKQI